MSTKKIILVKSKIDTIFSCLERMSRSFITSSFSQVLFLALFCSFFSQAYAQDNDKHERIKALKVSFITEKMELTPAEAEKFWPIYNTYDDKIHTLRHKEKELFKEKYNSEGNRKKLNEVESEKLIKNYNDTRDKRHLLEKQMMYDLIKKLPPSKIVFLPEVEDAFSRMLFEEYKKRNKNEEP
ncbi:hypothetical protein [Flavimarina sp. Hel_I_48]|uniref:hypothetical protein n=1 Tax=Flavimarina sp. Hel_I_48 TaxID=1392488 RepID=UPI00068BD407|nr:hypothetical protein [Flavimarina sp. Hel_I_48]